MFEGANPEALSIAAIVELSQGLDNQVLVNKAKSLPAIFSELPLTILSEFYLNFIIKALPAKKLPRIKYSNTSEREFLLDMAAYEYFENVFSNWPNGVIAMYDRGAENRITPAIDWRQFAKRLMIFPAVTHGLVSDGLSLSMMLSFTTKHHALPENKVLTRSCNEDETFRAIYNMLNKYRVNDVAWG